MALRRPPIVALEVGTSMVRAVIAEAHENGHLMVTGFGECATRGVRKGAVVAFDLALHCVRSALDQAEQQAKVIINEVFLALSAGQVDSRVNRGKVPVMHPDMEITDEEVRNVQRLARAVLLPNDRELLHSIPQRYFVDEQPGMVDPKGMEGSTLALEMLLIHALSSPLRNMIKVVKSADVEVPLYAFGGLCAGLAVLTAEQKSAGALVIDLGGGTTDFVVYADAAIADAGSISVGGEHVTNDISLVMKISMAQAEKVKREHGRAQPASAARGQRLSIPAEGGFEGRTLRTADLCAIISARMDETFTMILERLRRNGLLSRIGGGVILTGGGSRLRQVPDLAAHIFDMPCVVGMPRNITGLALVSEGPDFATLLGAARFGVRREPPGRRGWLWPWPARWGR